MVSLRKPDTDYIKALAWFAAKGYSLPSLSQRSQKKYGKPFLSLTKNEINELATELTTPKVGDAQ